MKRPLATAVVGLALLTALTALSACDDEPEQKGPTLGPGDQYVALGDSYTAAPGTGTESQDNCRQSIVDYPHQIAEATGADLVDNSCSGANTSHLTEAKIGTDAGPQLDAVNEDTDLVTMRLGANDFNLIGRIFFCSRLFRSDLPGTPCADADAKRGADSLDSRLPEVQANLDRAVDDIEDRAPDADIILIGYPHVAPAEGTCALLPLPVGDYDYARRVIDGLNDALEAVADDHDLTYIDMEGPSEGHDTCGEEPWMAGPVPVPGAAAPWHPYAAEGQAVAELVLEELNQ